MPDEFGPERALVYDGRTACKRCDEADHKIDGMVGGKLKLRTDRKRGYGAHGVVCEGEWIGKTLQWDRAQTVAVKQVSSNGDGKGYIVHLCLSFLSTSGDCHPKVPTFVLDSIVCSTSLASPKSQSLI